MIYKIALTIGIALILLLPSAIANLLLLISSVKGAGEKHHKQTALHHR